MIPIGTFESKRYGQLQAFRATYGSADGPLAIVLKKDGVHLVALSVNMYRPDCSHDSRALPADCFYVKGWGGHEEFVSEAMASGLFMQREDLPRASSGFVSAPVWQIKPKVAAGG